jgi:hypothetical protein
MAPALENIGRPWYNCLWSGAYTTALSKGPFMNAEAIREMLGRRPFEPFEVVMSSGERHVVKHPEFAILLPSRLIVTDPVADRAAMLSLIHVTELRPVQPQESA